MAKTNPTSIRFEEEQLLFFMEREKINSPQKVVNFLLQDYWIRNKLLPEIGGDHKQYIQQNPNYQPPIIPKPLQKTFQDYMNEISKCEYEPEFKKLWTEIQSSETLSDRQKQTLKLNMSKSNL